MRRWWLLVVLAVVLLVGVAGGRAAGPMDLNTPEPTRDDPFRPMQETADARVDASDQADLNARVDDLEGQVEDLRAEVDALSTRVTR